MGFQAELSPKAYNDLDSIFDYISDVLCNPVAAKRFWLEVHKKKSNIEYNPYMYALYHDDKMAALGCRYAVIGNYIMLYLIDESSNTVNIVRVIYGGRDIPAIMEEELL